MKKCLVFLTACALMSVMVSCSENKESSVSGTTEESSIIQAETHAYDENVDKNIFVGKWECCRLVANGEELTSLGSIPAYAVFQYNVLEDGTVTLPDSIMKIADPEEMVYYKWGAISDTEMEITGSDGSAIVYVLNDGKLENIDTNGEEIYLEKVDEFQDFDFETYYKEIAGQYVLTPVETDAAGNVIGEGEPITIN
ncbi:MAG: hypothetical protein NC040_03290 [Muribaculaceae bacterium]|nr:hypothetical protein [Alistipes senegalensis]MCM1473057.1 hypothetical protein [Muribaculaceae bacterium]